MVPQCRSTTPLLEPWFKADDINIPNQYSQSFTENCIYAVNKEHIELNPDRISYLKNNSGILKVFCYWNLSLYPQNKNPNVPNFPNKLIGQSALIRVTECAYSS